MFHKKISSDLFLLILLVVRLRLDSDFDPDNRWNREPESRAVHLGSSFAYTQINFHLPQSNIRLAHPKSWDLNEADLLFNRFNYFNSVRERRSHLLAYYASYPDGRSTGPSTEGARVDGTGQDAGPGNPSLPMGSVETTTEASGTQAAQDLTPEDMDLIEILWKQDIDLGVTREAYDICQSVDSEKLKDLEFSKEQMQDFLTHQDIKRIEQDISLPDEFAGLNYTIDSETGECILDELGVFTESDTSDEPLLQRETAGALRQDSYLPFDESAQMLNLTEVFSPATIEHMLPENVSSDSEFFLSQIEDLEKELAQFHNLNESYTTPIDMFPNLDDCLSDANMLPLLALSGNYQESFPSLSPRTGQEYSHLINDNGIPVAPTLLNRPVQSFTNLLQSSSLQVATTDEAFQTIPTLIGPASIGCAVVESMATLTNDTDPIPTSSIINTAYHSEIPEILYANQTTRQNELPFSDLLLDDDYMLVGLPSNVQDLSSEDNIDSSCDAASFNSGQNPSTPGCADGIDSCSESSSQYGDGEEVNQNSGYLSNSHISSSFSEHQTFELFHSAMPSRKLKQVQNKNLDLENRKINGGHIANENQHNSHYFSYKTCFPDLSQNSDGMMASTSATPCKKFDLTLSRPSEASCDNFLSHNHSYHLPFVNDDSRCKPFVRDKSSDEDYCNRDEKRAKELKLPISIDDIINLAIDEYNERLAKYDLTEAQLTLIRDIRRRGKNKVAAQNCRKRKMDQISHLQQDLDALHRERLQLKSHQNHLLQQKHHVEDKYTQLYQLVLQSTSTKPPSPPRSSTNRPLQSRHEINFSMTSDILMSDDDTDLSRGARTKRKMKK